jgi:uncharacterized protein (DUF1697 family)
MSQLKALFEEIGFKDVATFIASGNVVFSSRMQDRARLESKISKHLEKALGYEVETFVRSRDEVLAIAKNQPFSAEGQGATTIHVCMLHEPLSKAESGKLEKIRTPADEFAVRGREFYWLCRTRTAESTVWQLPEMKALGLPSSTMRNMTSIGKLIAKHLP